MTLPARSPGPPLSRTNLAILALFTGGLVAAAIVLPSALAPPSAVVGSPPTAGCGYLVGTELSSQFASQGRYLYNFSILDISGGVASTAWTQFFAFDTSTYAEIPLLVEVLGQDGHAVALFNSSRSTFSVGASLNSRTFPNLGGWVTGYGEPVTVNDTFAIQSSVSLNTTESSTFLEMGSVNAPHCMMGYTLLS